MNKRYLECNKLDKIYPPRDGKGKAHVVVRDFDLAIAEGEFVTLIGHSGCGKSTVLSMLAGLTPKSGGYMILGDYEIDDAGPDRGVVFQSPSLLPWLSAIDNVLIGAEQVYPEASTAQRAARSLPSTAVMRGLPTRFSAPTLKNAQVVDWLQYSVAIQSAERVLFEMRNSSREPLRLLLLTAPGIVPKAILLPVVFSAAPLELASVCTTPSK